MLIIYTLLYLIATSLLNYIFFKNSSPIDIIAFFGFMAATTLYAITTFPFIASGAFSVPGLMFIIFGTIMLGGITAELTGRNKPSSPIDEEPTSTLN